MSRKLIKDRLIDLLQNGDTVYCKIFEVDSGKILYKPEIITEIYNDHIITNHVGTKIKSIVYKHCFDIMPEEDIKLYYNNNEFNLDMIDEVVTFTYK